MKSFIPILLLLVSSFGLYSKAEENPKSKYTERKYIEKDFNLHLRAKNFKPGNLMIGTFEPNTDAEIDFQMVQIRWQNQKYKAHRYGQNKFLVFIPVHPDTQPGTKYIEVIHREKNHVHIKKYEVVIDKRVYETKITKLSFGKKKKYKPLKKTTLAFIKKCQIIKEEAYTNLSDLMVEGNFGYPLKKTKRITSSFYSKRIYQNKRIKAHKGVDISSKKGESIYAIQDGKVVLSMKMYYEGIFTVIDHGANVFSLYMHQSKTNVKKGDIVKKGDRIGRVGSTGMSTGPHLHLGLRVNGIFIDPFSVIDQSIY